jgi:hypothetical protein
MSDPDKRALRIRLGLGTLVLEGLVIGIHALLFPRYFYEHFFLGAGWLTKLGPYSEHLTRDAGALYLGLTIPTVWAVRRLTPDLVQPVALGNAFAAFPHMLYHLAHHHDSGDLATVPQAGTLLLTVVIALYVYRLSREQQQEAEQAAAPPRSPEPGRAGVVHGELKQG